MVITSGLTTFLKVVKPRVSSLVLVRVHNMRSYEKRSMDEYDVIQNEFRYVL